MDVLCLKFVGSEGHGLVDVFTEELNKTIDDLNDCHVLLIFQKTIDELIRPRDVSYLERVVDNTRQIDICLTRETTGEIFR